MVNLHPQTALEREPPPFWLKGGGEADERVRPKVRAGKAVTKVLKSWNSKVPPKDPFKGFGVPLGAGTRQVYSSYSQTEPKGMAKNGAAVLRSLNGGSYYVGSISGVPDL